MWPNLQKTMDLVTFTDEILNGKFPFLCNGSRNVGPESYGRLLALQFPSWS